MFQFLSIFFFLEFLQCLLGFSKVPVFLCHPVDIAVLRLSPHHRCTGGVVATLSCRITSGLCAVKISRIFYVSLAMHPFIILVNKSN